MEDDALLGMHLGSLICLLLEKLFNSEERFLGCLKISRAEPRDENGQLTEVVSYGCRSFSLFSLNDDHRPSLHWSSGDLLERIISDHYPQVFNSNPNNVDLTPEEAFDRRSDDSVS